MIRPPWQAAEKRCGGEWAVARSALYPMTRRNTTPGTSPGPLFDPAQPAVTAAEANAAEANAAGADAAGADAAGAVCGACVRVLLPLPLAMPYTYQVPVGSPMGLRPGSYVEVPLGARLLPGVVWESDVAPPPSLRSRRGMRAIIRDFALPPMPEVQRRFIDWVAQYTLTPAGAVLRMALSVPEALETPRRLVGWQRRGEAPDPAIRLTAARARVLDVLADGGVRSAADLAEAAGCSPAVVRGMGEAGLLESVALSADQPPVEPDPQYPGPVLSTVQAEVATELRVRVTASGYGVLLLDGVTGSGKTEVYCEAIAAALAAGEQVLVLLPEIALTAQSLARFTARFGAAPVLWHSDLTESRRRQNWRAIALGTARLVVGARSALFLPFARLGLIVVDEEHEGAYKQEEGVHYHGRDMAVTRAWLGRIPVILASATPSLETLVNVENGRYQRFALPDRHGGAAMPAVELVDLRKYPPPRQHWLSPLLRTAITDTVIAGEQVLLFLNRRGYAPLTLCRACGHRLQCPNCTAWLVEHRRTTSLQCHHCGHTIRLPESCPGCGVPARFAACGPGVERIAEEVAEIFPDLRTAVMTSDTLSGPAALQDLVRQVSERRLDLLIGTQIMAKGHHFPWLTLVGVVDADLGLSGGDVRAGERTFQLLHQVAGRAGRAERPGRVLLQTYMPEHPVMQALVRNDRDGFLALEIAQRRQSQTPPFGRLAALIVSGEVQEAVVRTAQALARVAPHSATVRVLGPAPAPLALLRGRHRYRLLLQAGRSETIQPLIRQWLEAVPVPNDVKIQVDIDPYSFM